MALNFLNDGYFAGKVGIGKLAPTKPLDVIGNAGIEGTLTIETSSNNIRLLDSNDSTVNFSVGVNGRFQIRDVAAVTNPFQIEKGAASNSLYIDEDGFVGIGANDPTHKLVVNSGNTNVTSVFKSTDNQTWISIQDDDSGTYGALIGIDSDESENFVVANASAAKMLSLNSSGSLKLHNYDGTNQVGTPTYLLGTDASGNVLKVLDGGGTVTGSGTLDTIPLWTPDGDTLGNSVMTQSGANIGIGTTSYTNSSGYSTLNINGTSGGQIAFQTAGTSKHFIWGTATDFNIYNGQAGPLILYTSATEKMRILANGNIGIGTTNPSANLYVSGSNADATDKPTMISESVFTVKPVALNSGNLNFAQVDSGNSIGMQYTNGSGTANWDISMQPFGGNVGIGTTSPTAPLHVDGGTNSEVLRIEADSNPFVRWVENGTNVGFLQFLGDHAYLSNMSNGSFFFRTNNTDKMTILAGGNVGVGTTGPLEPLSVFAGTNESVYDVLGVYNSVTGTSAAGKGAAIRIGKDVDGNYSTKIATIYEGNNPSYLQPALAFFTMNNTYLKGSETEKMRISANGNVGIGTTGPNTKLQVSGTGLQGMQAWFGNGFVNNANYHYSFAKVGFSSEDNDGADPGAGFQFNTRNAADTNWMHGYIYQPQDGGIAFGTGGAGTTQATEKMRITSAGGISFGSTGTAYGSAGQVLTSAGNASPTWTTPTTGTVTGSGAATQVAFWNGTTSLSGNSNLYWDSTNNHLGIGDSTPGSRLKVASGTGETSIYTVDINHVRNDADVATHAMRLNVDLSGADTTTADRTNSGLYIDIDSSANGDLANEHRIYGVNSTINFTGFTDLARGGYFLAESNYTGAKTAQLVGVYGYAIHDANDAAGGVSNMYGVFGYSSIQDTGDVDNAFGAKGYVSIGDNRVADVGVTKAVEGEISIDKSTAINYGTMIGISSIIDNNEGSVPNFNDQYLFKGDYQGTKGPTAWGIYTEGLKHYFSNTVGIGTTTPDSTLEVQFAEAAGTIKRMLHLDYNPTDNYGSAVFKISSGSSANNVFKVEQVTGGGNGAFGTYLDSNIINANASSGAYGNINFVTGSSTSASSIVMTIGGGTQKGNVGIGTTSPTANLHVFDTAVAVKIEGNGVTSANLKFKTNDTDRWNLNVPSGSTDLRFTTGSSDTLTLKSSGNVGIGTTSPGSKLELGPNGSLGANITNKNVILNIDGGYGTTGTPSSGQYKVIGFTGTTKDVTDITGQTSGEVQKNFYLGMIGGDYFNVNRFSFWQGGDERLTIQGYGANAGNVGIGTTSPGTALQVGGLDDGSNYDITVGWNAVSSQAVGTKRSALTFKTSQTGVNNEDIYKWDIAMVTAPATASSEPFGSNLAFLRSTRSSTSVDETTMILTQLGNVGIGTTSPEEKLKVIGSVLISNNEFYKVENTTGTNYKIAGLTNGNVIQIGAIDYTSAGTVFAGGDNVSITTGGASGSTRIKIANSGNVGIGTTNPQSKLQVAGGIQMADDTATASAAKVGTMRYRTGTEYVDVTGTNLISNPDFTSDTAWNKETGWTISGGELVATAAAGNTACYQSPGLTNGSIYRCTFTISEYTSGKVSFRAGTTAANTFFDAVGTYSVIMTAGGALQGRFGLESGVTTTLKISQCSIVEVTEEDASYADMCMQTGSSTYEWVNIVRNTY